MASFDFLKNELPFGYAFNFENYLFNKTKHMALQNVEERTDFFLVNSFKKRIEAKIHFLIKGEVAYSPYKSLFGGIEMNPRIASGLVSQFLEYILKELKKEGIKKLEIVQHARSYNELKFDKIHQALLGCGFEAQLEAINHFIEVDDQQLSDRMHAMEQRKLRKNQEAGFVFAEETIDTAEEIFDFIKACREQKGLTISIPKELFNTYLEDFPIDYKLFAVRHEGVIIAATVTIRVCKRILYNFLPASTEAYASYSPMVYLLSGLYQYAQANRYEMIDLGVSTLKNGEHQETLIQFKENMGAKRDLKRFYSLSVE